MKSILDFKVENTKGSLALQNSPSEFDTLWTGEQSGVGERREDAESRPKFHKPLLSQWLSPDVRNVLLSWTMHNLNCILVHLLAYIVKFGVEMF